MRSIVEIQRCRGGEFQVEGGHGVRINNTDGREVEVEVDYLETAASCGQWVDDRGVGLKAYLIAPRRSSAVGADLLACSGCHHSHLAHQTVLRDTQHL